MFKNLLKKRLGNEKGLTLIELLAVVVILAIVAAIAVPAIGNIIENSRYNAVKADALNVLSGANIYFTENTSDDVATIAELKTAGFLEASGEIPDAAYVIKGQKLYLVGQVTVNNQTVTFTQTPATTIPTAAPATDPAKAASVDYINSDAKKGSELNASYIVGDTK